MPKLTHVGRVMVPVRDQDAAIAFYTEKLGFSVSADIPFGDGDRWVEVAPPAGETTIALTQTRESYDTGGMSGVALDSPDVRGDYEEFKAAGVDVDEQIIGGDGTVPLMFFFRDQDANHLLLVETQREG